MAEPRTIKISAIARVEGEGALNVTVRDGVVVAAELNIYEPPRFFEAFLRGREIREITDIVARICGICPVAYQMSAAHALEKALGVSVPAGVRELRRLLYCGEWIESHALHVYMLHAPDFMGFESGIAMAAKHRDIVERGLRMKKIGNRILEVLGGRAIHPINVTVGGFYRSPRVADVQALLPELQWGLAAAVETFRWAAAFDFPKLDVDYEMVSLRHPTEYPMNEGNVVSSSGLNIAPEEYEQHFEERHVPQSTALHSVLLPGGKPYLVGPLARVNLCRDQLSDTAKREADSARLDWPCRNNFKSILARSLEMITAFEEAARIVEGYRVEPTPSRAEVTLRAGEGCHATEAPRGLIYHRYRVGENGLIAEAKIVPPTSQNQGQVESDLAAYLPGVLHLADADVGRRCEHLIRNYDPCISCATHFLRVKIDRQ
ncbi:MAG: Ni/Fe hydrogenase subunit alpha [Planctomycetes bacterium]|nr:Ni/Fe hydrogenase subunit alpha [Planctomycetota bacterium]